MAMTQYMDASKEIGGAANSTVVFLPHNPASVTELGDQVRTALMQAEAAHIGAPDLGDHDHDGKHVYDPKLER